ncbi:FAS1 domain-containing protein [Echria macrotheca]|uniref:FAS1 domain-containing protein n=1 Tax=Echria macrotheca TaxID=438768 RepID=A0AAJ0F9Z7_9PEZI|nr:FAS1 domain-containing protein [Echria macrotheca]
MQLSSLATLGRIAAFASLAAADAASDLSAALSGYPQLNDLRTLVDQLPSVVNTIIGDRGGVTVLAPNDDAFQTYAVTNDGVQLFNASRDFLTNLLSYHILAADVTSSNFSSEKGITTPTLLQGQLYNNRSAGPEFVQTYGKDANGQVVYTRPSGGHGYVLSGGDADNVTLTALNHQWRRGFLHMIDGVLPLPKNCTETMEDQPLLKTLSESLEGTTIYDAIDTLANVTCLAPTSDAFDAAGNPQSKLNTTEYGWLIREHVIAQPLYIDRLRDGQVLQSLRNTTIKVSMNAGDIYFNNAKVVKSNVITNNGVIYVLDKLLAASPTGTSPSSTGTAPSSTATKDSAAHGRIAVNPSSLAALVAGMLLLRWI